MRYLPALISIPVIVWGARATFLEGFAYAVPRGFTGDFTAAMFPADGSAPDPTTIVYGPIFLFEQWLTRAFPGVFTITTYAILCWVLVATAFVACVVAARLRRPLVPVALAAWLVFTHLSYGLAIAANPEFLILAFLSVAWVAAARGRSATEGAAVAAGGLTKLIPFVFAVPLLLRRDRRALVALLGVTAVAILIASIGLRRDPVSTALASLLPFGRESVGESVGFASMVLVSGEFLGVNSALARALGLGPSGSGSLLPPDVAVPVQVVTVTVILACVLAAAWIAHRVRQGSLATSDRVALTYAAFFALLPIANPFPHGHTFILLMPLAVALLAVLDTDPDRMRRSAFLVTFGALYVYTGVPAVPLFFDRLLGTPLVDAWNAGEPIWGAIGMLAGIGAYVLLRLRAMPRATVARPDLAGARSQA